MRCCAVKSLNYGENYALSRRKHGFKSRRGRQSFQQLGVMAFDGVRYWGGNNGQNFELKTCSGWHNSNLGSVFARRVIEGRSMPRCI